VQAFARMPLKIFPVVTTLIAFPAAPAQDLFLDAQQVFERDVLLAPREEPQHQCPPLKWIKQSMSEGAFILNYTDDSWGAYMDFLQVDKSHWYDEFHASDIWQYAFYDNTFIMNHTIPKTNFHLLYETSLKGDWVKNPYPCVTPAGFDPKAGHVKLSSFRNFFEKPGRPHPDSCWALRTEMPVVTNITGEPIEYVVKFWREMTSPSDMRCTLTVYDASTGETIEPWATKMKDTKPFPNYAYRYFRHTVQSFGDIVKRLPCRPTGVRKDTYFC